MDLLKKYLPKLDVILLLTVISYALVYCYNYGATWYYQIPIRFIELGVNNLTDTLIALCFLISLYIPFIMDIKTFPNKVLLYFLGFLTLFGLYTWFSNKTIPSITLIFMGCICLFFFSKIKMKSFFFVVAILFMLISAIFIGYSTAYNVNVEGRVTFYFENKDQKYVIVGYYSNYYIVSKLNPENNTYYPEYQLFPIDYKVNNEPIIIKTLNEEIKFKKN